MVARESDSTVVGPESQGAHIVNQILGCVLDGTNLLHDDILLALKLRFGEDGVEQHVGKELHREIDMLWQDEGREASELPVGEGIQLPTDRIEELVDLPGRTRASAFE
jgi:hypothetical protein